MGLRILVAGAGGREHALLWKLAQSPNVEALFCAPGNPGSALIARNLPVRSRDIDGMKAAAIAERIDLAIIGPEEPLAAGLSDALNTAEIRVCGPSKAAARIESSKSWAKELMREAGIPTARSVAASGLIPALSALEQFDIPVVIKADGLAHGTGTVVVPNRTEAQFVLTAFLEEDVLGPAGRTVIVEERLNGPEYSVTAATDGERLLMLPPVRVYKRLTAGDTSPNTPGMGAAVTPKPIDTATMNLITRAIMQPAIDALAKRGAPFRGFLSAGVILTASGPKVLEFNARLGDPDAQVLMPVLDVDLAELCFAAAHGSLADFSPIPTPQRSAVGVVLASEGYPGPHKANLPISGLGLVPDGALVFHNATRGRPGGQAVGAAGSGSTSLAANQGDECCTGGGRVLTVVGLDEIPAFARSKAYAAAERIAFDGVTYRRDIGR